MSRIETATRAHLPLLAAMHARCFPRDPWDEKSLAEILAIPTAFGRVALDGAARPAGFALAVTPAGVCDVATLCVLPEARRRGVARRLVEGLILEARRRGAEEVTLEVGEHNRAARALYEAAGFACLGRRNNYYRDGEAALTLKLLLR